MIRNTIFLLILCFFNNSFAQKRHIELQDIWKSGVFFPKSESSFNILNDGKSFCKIDFEDKFAVINVYDLNTGEKIKQLLNTKELFGTKDPIQISDFQFDDNQKKILLTYNSVSIYRHSVSSNFIVVDLANNVRIRNFDKKSVMYPSIDPSGRFVAYVMENNLYLLNLSNNKIRKVTKDGEKNKIINGAVDWVYEEEFSMSRGYEWNTDGTQIAFYRFDESRVKEWQLPQFGNLYTDYYKYKYPKAGELNSIVDVLVARTDKGKPKKLKLGSENDQYIPRIQWTNNPNVLSIQRLNRLQNKWELLMYDGKNISLSVEEESETYVEVPDKIFFLKDDKHMIVSSEQDGYHHLYFHKVSGPIVFQITKGKWDIDKVLWIDESTEKVYYSSSEVSPTERHIYEIGFDGKNKKRLTSESGWHSADFFGKHKVVLHTLSTINSAPKYMLRLANWDLIRNVELNEKFDNSLEDFIWNPAEFSNIDVNGESLNYWIIKPANFDEGKKYPVLMYVYGGPGSQTVKNSFGYSNFFWYQMLANKYGYIVISVDNRGTGARGAEFKKITYKQLGKYETEDQIAVAKKIGEWSFVDKNRIGIWGWSYGGYMSSLCLAKGADVFKMAIAVAPVTNWRFYDNIYTERYMALPKDNANGYDDNSPINHVDKITGKYLIVQGSSDDNVHYENTILMIDALIKNNITYESEVYPNKNHGIYGGNTRYHLYNRMTNFILNNL